MVLTPPVAMLLAIKASQVIYGYEHIVFYQQTIVVDGATVGTVALAGGPVATTLDATTLGMGIGLAFGRIGCFRVACCHGRRARCGVRYGEAHAAAGFPARWIGLPLVPLPLIDGAVSLAATVTAVLMWRDGAAAGVAAAVYLGIYGVGRFALEFGRGDPVRATRGGITEAQASAAITTAAAAALHPTWWTLSAAGVLLVGSALLVVAHRWDLAPGWTLATAHHVDELADAIARGAAVTTRAGVRVTVGRLPDGRTDVVMTRPGRRLDRAAIARAAAQLGHPGTAYEIVPGRVPGLFHLIMAAAEPAQSSV